MAERRGRDYFSARVYHNNTNVRFESDMDLKAVHPFIQLEYALDVIVDSAKAVLGIVNMRRTYWDVAQEMRRQIVSELSKKFHIPSN